MLQEGKFIQSSWTMEAETTSSYSSEHTTDEKQKSSLLFYRGKVAITAPSGAFHTPVVTVQDKLESIIIS